MLADLLLPIAGSLGYVVGLAMGWFGGVTWFAAEMLKRDARLLADPQEERLQQILDDLQRGRRDRAASTRHFSTELRGP